MGRTHPVFHLIKSPECTVKSLIIYAVLVRSCLYVRLLAGPWVQNLEGGWPKIAIFARGALPLGHLSVTSNRDSSLATQRSVPLSDS